jgi:hypothetical protein
MAPEASVLQLQAWPVSRLSLEMHSVRPSCLQCHKGLEAGPTLNASGHLDDKEESEEQVGGRAMGELAVCNSQTAGFPQCSLLFFFYPFCCPSCSGQPFHFQRLIF